MYVRMHVYMQTCICMYVCMYMCICTYVCVFMYVCTYVSMYVCMFLCINVFVYVYVCIDTFMYNLCNIYVCLHVYSALTISTHSTVYSAPNPQHIPNPITTLCPHDMLQFTSPQSPVPLYITCAHNWIDGDQTACCLVGVWNVVCQFREDH